MSSAANVRYLVGILSLSAFHRGTARTFLTKFANASAGIMAKLQYGQFVIVIYLKSCLKSVLVPVLDLVIVL